MKRVLNILIVVCCLVSFAACAAKMAVEKPAGDIAAKDATKVEDGKSLPSDSAPLPKMPGSPSREGDKKDKGPAALAVKTEASAMSAGEGTKAVAEPRKTAGKAKKMAAKPSPASPPMAFPASRPSAPVASGLKAGYADDNKQFNSFLSFLKKHESQAPHYPLQIEERIILRIHDRADRPIANASVRILAGSNTLCDGKSYTDGTFLFFPGEHGTGLTRYQAVVTVQQERKEIAVDRQGMREITVKMSNPRSVSQSIPLDLLFILDTTGSMGEEINRLKNTIEIINLNLSSLSTKPEIRFGMVLYKDRGDVYVTKVVPLTDSLEHFQAELNKVKAEGGGDTPEDLQSALADSIRKINWNPDGIRLAFIITDAPPHLDYGQPYTYVNAVQDARRMGIKMFSVGTGGLNLAGEYVLRQIAQYTYGRYIFLTYGEKGESEGGREGSVSHHTGANFQTDKLESIIIRFAKEELSNMSDQPLPEGDAYFQAVPIPDEGREDTLRKLFEMSISQLLDYASIKIATGTPASMIPFSVDTEATKANAEYFSEQMGFSLSRNKTFRLVERRDMQKVFEELKLNHSGIVDDKTAAKAGKLLGAEIIITGRVYRMKDNYEIFMKMLRVETGEVLSVNKLKIDGRLGLGMPGR